MNSLSLVQLTRRCVYRCDYTMWFWKTNTTRPLRWVQTLYITCPMYSVHIIDVYVFVYFQMCMDVALCVHVSILSMCVYTGALCICIYVCICLHVWVYLVCIYIYPWECMFSLLLFTTVWIHSGSVPTTRSRVQKGLQEIFTEITLLENRQSGRGARSINSKKSRVLGHMHTHTHFFLHCCILLFSMDRQVIALLQYFVNLPVIWSNGLQNWDTNAILHA